MSKTIALALKAKSFAIIDNKKYKFYLTGDRIFEIEKNELKDSKKVFNRLNTYENKKGSNG